MLNTLDHCLVSGHKQGLLMTQDKLAVCTALTTLMPANSISDLKSMRPTRMVDAILQSMHT